MENLEHRGSVNPVSNTVDIDVLNKCIEEKERELFCVTPTIDTEASRNPLLKFFGEKLGAKFIPATAAISLIVGACGDGNSGVDVDFVTREPGQTIVTGNTKEATNASESNTPTPDPSQVGKGDGATAASGILETSTPTPEPTKEPKPPIYESEKYPYELVVVKEYQGPEVKFVFGIEKAAYERLEDNKCKENVEINPRIVECPPIRRFELSDDYLKKYAPDKFPDGMSQEEMIQRMNDFELSLIVWNMKQKGFNQDLTVEKLKDMIHKGTAPEFVQSFANGSSLQWNINKDGKYEVHYIALDKPPKMNGQVKMPYTGLTVEYSKIDGARVVGIWHWTSFLQNYTDGPNHFATVGPAAAIMDANVMVSYDLYPVGKVNLQMLDNIVLLNQSENLGIVVVSK